MNQKRYNRLAVMNFNLNKLLPMSLYGHNRRDSPLAQESSVISLN